MDYEMNDQRVTTSTKSLFDHLKMFEESRDKKYSVLKLLQRLGDEPWDCDVVLQLYMENHINMGKILKKHAGYEAHLEIFQIKNLLLKLGMFKGCIEKEIKKCNESYLYNVSTEGQCLNEMLTGYQTAINLYCYGYSSLCYTIMEHEKIICKKYANLKSIFSSIFDAHINNSCHKCLMMIRHKLNHGVPLEFKWSVDLETRKVKFILQGEVVKNIEPHCEKDRLGIDYLHKTSGDVESIIFSHYGMMERFCASLCDSLFSDKKIEIYQCNEYYKKILTKMDTQYRAIAKSVGKDGQISETKINETHYLDRAMGYIT